MDLDLFIEKLVKEVKKTGIETDNLKIDHIAYRTATSGEYDKLLPDFMKEGKLIKEAIIGGRRVAIIKYFKPIGWEGQNIEAVELIEPKSGEEPFSGWEHVEFLVDDYDDVLSRYPNLNWNTDSKDRKNFSRIKLELPGGMEVKFLDTPVLDSANS